MINIPPEKALSISSACPTALAPMQDVTSLPFMTLISERGEPDIFFTEFFRVHANSRLDPEILSSVTQNPTGRPVFAQIIGENTKDITRAIGDLAAYPIAGVDLNMGCPAPRVYRKNVGGSLLKDPEKVARILDAMRTSWHGALTVKMRIGFEDDRNFEKILGIILDNKINLLSLHVRTVKGGYNTLPQYQYVTKAVHFLGDRCPVLANGSIETAEDAWALKRNLGAFGVMVGRAAIRNPWIFRQIREVSNGFPPFAPKRSDLYEYCLGLYQKLSHPEIEEKKLVSRMKKFLNYVGLSLDDGGSFLQGMRHAVTQKELFSIFEEHLFLNGKLDWEISQKPQASALKAVRNKHESGSVLNSFCK